jgi:glycerol uptake facilitator-like aquaporin
VINVSASYGSNYPASGYSAFDACLMEAVLTFGLVSVILGTASGAQNIGIFGAIGVGAYIALAGLWGSPISGASMNPARTFGRTSSQPTSRATGCMSQGPFWVQFSQWVQPGCFAAPAAAAPAQVRRREPSSRRSSTRARREGRVQSSRRLERGGGRNGAA